jgi:prepilin peptidase CpaA
VFLALWPALFLLFPEGIDWQTHLLTFAVAFAVGFVIFILKWMGGGDVKMLAVCGLWLGTQPMMTFLVIMGLLGGGLAIALVVIRKILAFWYKPEQLPRLLKIGEPAPYGIAIAGAFLILLWDHQIPGLL